MYAFLSEVVALDVWEIRINQEFLVENPGTRIEQVLAYCRNEKIIGCIELLF